MIFHPLQSPHFRPCLHSAHQVRIAQIDAELRRRGLAMEHSLAVFEGDEGHAILDLASGESIDPPDDQVLALAIEWSGLADLNSALPDRG